MAEAKPEVPLNPPQRYPVEEWNTPNFSAGFFTEIIDTKGDPGYTQPQRGMLYSSIRGANPATIKRWPNLYFLRETRLGSSATLVLWTWGTDPQGEDNYNSEVYYAAEAVDCPGYIRAYTVRRDEYDANPSVAAGSVLATVISITVSAGGSGYNSATATASNGATLQVNLLNGVISSIVVQKQGAPVSTAPVISITGNGTGATASAVLQNQQAVLISQKKQELPDGHPLQNEYVRVIRTYQVLPGPPLYGQQYLEDLDTTVEFITQEVATASDPIGTARTDVSPIDSIRAQLKTMVNPSQLGSLSYSMGRVVQIDLPDTLVSAGNLWTESGGAGSSSAGIVDVPDGVNEYSFSVAHGSQSSSAVAGDMTFIIRRGFRGPVGADRVIFFLPLTACSINDVLASLGVEVWPVFREESVMAVLTGGSVSSRDNYNDQYLIHQSTSGQVFTHTTTSESTDSDGSATAKPVQIPFTLHGDVPVENATYSGGLSVGGNTSPSTIPATSPSSFPTGTFLYELETRPFMVGWAMVSATLVTITDGMVN